MRIKLEERGTVYSETYYQKYIEYYTQPVSYAVLAWIFHHLWEPCTWRILRYFEKYQNLDNDTAVPYTARQDLRCSYLYNKSRIITSTTYKDPITYVKASNDLL